MTPTPIDEALSLEAEREAIFNELCYIRVGMLDQYSAALALEKLVNRAQAAALRRPLPIGQGVGGEAEVGVRIGEDAAEWMVSGAAPAPPVVDREVLARIVDPKAFKNWDKFHDYCLRAGDTPEEARATADWAHKAECDAALNTADLILAALNQGGETARDHERSDVDQGGIEAEELLASIKPGDWLLVRVKAVENEPNPHDLPTPGPCTWTIEHSLKGLQHLVLVDTDHGNRGWVSPENIASKAYDKLSPSPDHDGIGRKKGVES